MRDVICEVVPVPPIFSPGRTPGHTCHTGHTGRTRGEKYFFGPVPEMTRSLVWTSGGSSSQFHSLEPGGSLTPLPHKWPPKRLRHPFPPPQQNTDRLSRARVIGPLPNTSLILHSGIPFFNKQYKKIVHPPANQSPENHPRRGERKSFAGLSARKKPLTSSKQKQPQGGGGNHGGNFWRFMHQRAQGKMHTSRSF